MRKCWGGQVQNVHPTGRGCRGCLHGTRLERGDSASTRERDDGFSSAFHPQEETMLTCPLNNFHVTRRRAAWCERAKGANASPAHSQFHRWGGLALSGAGKETHEGKNLPHFPLPPVPEHFLAYRSSRTFVE